jgi:uncharacterized protein YmfQ (DUF2313 family)
MTCGKFEPREGDGLTALQAHLPSGDAWLGFRVIGKKLYQLAEAIGWLLDDMSAEICRLARELSPYTTEELLPEWERALGLPDACFGSGRSLDERRFAVQEKLARRRYTTIDTWRALAARMGIAARITPGDLLTVAPGYDETYPLIYGGWRAGGRFRVYIEAEACAGSGYDYAYDFAYPTDSARCAEFKCVIERIRPCCVIVIWGPPPAVPDRDEPSFDDINITWDSEEVTF